MGSDKAEKELGAMFPKSWADVYRAALGAIPTIPKMRVKSADQGSGRIIAKKGMTMRSWGEEIVVDVWEISPGKAGVRVNSRDKVELIDWRQNEQNVALILDVIAGALKTPAQPLPPPG